MSNTRSVKFRTTGATRKTAGKATGKAPAHAFIQIDSRLSTNPTFRMLTISDIRQDINKAIKKANTIASYFRAITVENSCTRKLKNGPNAIAGHPGVRGYYGAD